MSNNQGEYMGYVPQNLQSNGAFDPRSFGGGIHVPQAHDTLPRQASFSEAPNQDVWATHRKSPRAPSNVMNGSYVPQYGSEQIQHNPSSYLPYAPAVAAAPSYGNQDSVYAGYGGDNDAVGHEGHHCAGYGEGNDAFGLEGHHRYNNFAGPQQHDNYAVALQTPAVVYHNVQQRSKVLNHYEPRPHPPPEHQIMSSIRSMDEFEEKEQQLLRAEKQKTVQLGGRNDFPANDPAAQRTLARRIRDKMVSVDNVHDTMTSKGNIPGAVAKFQKGYYSEELLEMQSWNILRAIRDKSIDKKHHVKVKGVSWIELNFRERFEKVLEALELKALCKGLLDPSTVDEVVSNPHVLLNRYIRNDKLNKQRDKTNAVGKKVLKEERERAMAEEQAKADEDGDGEDFDDAAGAAMSKSDTDGPQQQQHPAPLKSSATSGKKRPADGVVFEDETATPAAKRKKNQPATGAAASFGKQTTPEEASMSTSKTSKLPLGSTALLKESNGVSGNKSNQYMAYGSTSQAKTGSVSRPYPNTGLNQVFHGTLGQENDTHHPSTHPETLMGGSGVSGYSSYSRPGLEKRSDITVSNKTAAPSKFKPASIRPVHHNAGFSPNPTGHQQPHNAGIATNATDSEVQNLHNSANMSGNASAPFKVGTPAPSLPGANNVYSQIRPMENMPGAGLSYGQSPPNCSGDSQAPGPKFGSSLPSNPYMSQGCQAPYTPGTDGAGKSSIEGLSNNNRPASKYLRGPQGMENQSTPTSSGPPKRTPLRDDYANFHQEFSQYENTQSPPMTSERQNSLFANNNMQQAQPSPDLPSLMAEGGTGASMDEVLLYSDQTSGSSSQDNALEQPLKQFTNALDTYQARLEGQYLEDGFLDRAASWESEGPL